ncbi:MAG TPA: translation initiation factor IF-2 [Euryarchaeota archaeon]|nr:translation initiation factor IF-2 [Euryarchaeota archaeon]
MRIRQPIVTVLGHVDHGKTTILDKIRRTTVQKKEAGGITQHIGATEVPIDVIEKITKPLTKMFPVKFKIPGLLFIDTPGHEAFTNLRKRGGSIADIAVLVVDVNQGFQPQTREAVEILKTYRVPFVVAANKVDAITGWVSKENSPITESLKRQRKDVLQELDTKIYQIVASLSEYGFDSERYDRVTDFTKQIVIIPTSGKTGEGIPELLLYLAGLAQKYLEKRLEIDENAPGKGAILEVKEETGIGTTLTTILYDGVIRKGDRIVFGTKDGPKETRVRALLKPKPLDEIRDPRDKFRGVDEVHAAAGLKIAAPDIDDAIPGSPVVVVRSEEERRQAIEQIKNEIASISFETDDVGLIVKADTLGSLEALVKILRDHGYPVKKAEIGNVSKKDVMEASVVRQKDRYLGAVIAFNVGLEPGVEEEAFRLDVPIIRENVVYRIIERYQSWREEEREREKKEKLTKLILPGKIKILEGYVFRRSDPAIVGVRVLAGVVKPKYPLMREDGRPVGTIKGMQKDKKGVEEAHEGDELAVAIQGPLVGRHIFEGDVLYTDVPENHIKELLRNKHLIPESYIEVLQEIAEIKRKRGGKE